MKKYFITRLIFVIAISSIIIMSLFISFQLNTAENNYKNMANLQLLHIKTILDENEADAENIENSLEQDYILTAKTVDYFLQSNPAIINDVDELKKIAELLQVDEINIFNSNGEIFSGSIPEYYGFTLYSGSQMRFFTPMLSNKSLQLIQDITPNTAKGKEMQYTAIWSENGDNIIQIGIEPVRLLEAYEKTELNFIFSRLAPIYGVSIIALDYETGNVLASTNHQLNNAHFDDLGIEGTSIENINYSSNIKTTINNNSGIILFEKLDNIVIGVNGSTKYVYQSTFEDVTIIAIGTLVISTLLISCIYFILDRVVIRDIYLLINGMKRISAGDLEYRLSISGAKEFVVLTAKINKMVETILESSGRLSTIFSYTNMPIAVFEQKDDHVIATSKINELLETSNKEIEQALSNPMLFSEIINNITSTPVPKEKDIYLYNVNDKVKYFKIKQYYNEISSWGIIQDITEEINEKQNIKKERDMDFLTDIYNRRAFLEELENLSENPSKLKNAAMIMMDLDNLKFVNDSWGHSYGDKFIATAAYVLKNISFEKKLNARLSGDEFVTIIYGAASKEELQTEIDKLQKSFTTSFILNPSGNKHMVTVSGGYAFYPDDSTSLKELLHITDETMYKAKTTQKGSFKKFEI